MPKKTDALVFDISRYREDRAYVWREIPRDGRAPLRVKLLDLSIRQTNGIPWGMSVPLQDSMKIVAPYVVEWDLEARSVETDEVMPVPCPADAGWEVFELLSNKEASDIINWLKIPHYMKAEESKKLPTESENTSDPPNGDD